MLVQCMLLLFSVCLPVIQEKIEKSAASSPSLWCSRISCTASAWFVANSQNTTRAVVHHSALSNTFLERHRLSLSLDSNICNYHLDRLRLVLFPTQGPEIGRQKGRGIRRPFETTRRCRGFSSLKHAHPLKPLCAAAVLLVHGE
ncbi:unnamed protein product [Durusdinium trenchii]|uniref:Secreted protein n=1 Tax=Durusdinium trenchii TaxID=1381693 RepID=A0ABP0N580_9DINO